MKPDKISSLPDDLLKHILLYLPTKDLVKTSVLSKRWEFLWLKVSQLDLNTINFPPYGKDLHCFMDRFLEFNLGSCLQKFKIKFGHYQTRRKKIKYDGPMEWIAEVIHRGVIHLEVEYQKCSFQGFGFEKEISKIKELMPKYLYVSKTLVSLKLVKVGLENPKFDVTLPSLKNMHLENIYYKTHGLLIIERFISGSPFLEDLTMDFPVSTKAEQEDFTQNFIVSPEAKRPEPVVERNAIFLRGMFHLRKPKKIVFTNVPRCLSSSLEYVKINKLTIMEETDLNKLTMMEEIEIQVVNYFLENSRILKKMSLSLRHSSVQDQDQEHYMKLFTSTKVSSGCQVLFH